MKGFWILAWSEEWPPSPSPRPGVAQSPSHDSPNDPRNRAYKIVLRLGQTSDDQTGLYPAGTRHEEEEESSEGGKVASRLHDQFYRVRSSESRGGGGREGGWARAE